MRVIVTGGGEYLNFITKKGNAAYATNYRGIRIYQIKSR